jgi:tryptophanyl-tRNA synthetase
MKPILVSGIQPTGKLHIGNYLGALKNFVALQNSGKYQCYFFVADLHSLTEDFDPKEKPAQIRDLVADMLSAGIDPKKSVIFTQSAIPENSELAWILNTITPFGELRRMTQFKDKSEHAPENINLGLFDYPVLMAADIILYDAKFVPVGDDQLQHLEFTRTLARKFNNKYPGRAGGETFIEPQPIITSASRIMSLDEPKKKMSKSRPAGCLFIDDSPEVIRKKIMSAVTDSGNEVKYDPENKPAISNLIRLYGGIINRITQQIEQKFAGASYSEFKKSLAEEIVKSLVPFQKKKKEFLKNAGLINKTVAAGNKKAALAAQKKIKEVKKKIGLLS